MNRRSLLTSTLSLFNSVALIPLFGCNMTTRNIRSFGKKFTYLKDPEHRTREIGDAPLLIEKAMFSGEQFDDQIWKNIRFVDCEFSGAYEIRLSALQECRFERCRFHDAVIGWGTAEKATFFDCHVTGDSNIAGDVGSRDVRFEGCNFQGPGSDPNQWGTIGTYGQTEFIKCNARWFSMFGFSRTSLRDCVVEEGEIRTDSDANSGPNFQRSDVLIESCKLRGTFDLVAADLQSLTIRDTVLDHLDLTNATIKDDLVIERVRGGAIQVGIKEAARAFSMKDSQIYGNGISVCYVYAGAFDSVLIERCVFGGDVTKPVIIGGGFDPDNKETQPVMTRRLALRDNRIPFLRSGYLNAGDVVIEGNTFESLDLQQGRLDSLEIAGNTITRTANFTGAQAKKSKVQRLARDQAKLDGSNIKLN